MRATAASIAVCLALAGCGLPGFGDSSFDVPVGTTSYDADAASWFDGSAVHVGDEVIPVEPAPDIYVVAAAGIYYLASGTLFYTDGGPVQDVAEVGTQSLSLSPDGRYLGLIDAARGRTDGFDTHVATPVVFDLETGDEVLRAEPTGSLDDQDLADFYSEVTPYVAGFVEDDLVAFEPLSGDDLTVYPLDGADPRPALVSATGFTPSEFDGRIETEQGFAGSLPRESRKVWNAEPFASTLSGTLSPGRDVAFVTLGGPTRARFYDATTGKPTDFDAGAPGFRLGGWVDDQTFYGLAYRGAQPTTGRIVTCGIESADCTGLGDEVRVSAGPLFPGEAGFG